MTAPDPTLDASLGRLLDQVPALRERRRIEELPGGLTNRNLRVETPAGDYVVRCFGSDAGLLAIDRDAEHHNSRMAAVAGVGAPVVDYRPDLGLLVIGYLPGRTLTEADFADPGVLRRAAAACRLLHAGPRFAGTFDMFARQAGYRRTVAEHGFTLPADYDDHAHDWERVRRALAASAPTTEPATVPCNNDLLAGNFVDDGERVWLIDYEYSGNNDPCFELGNTATECELGPDQVAAYVEAYDGRLTVARLARVRLQMLVSEYGWALWGFIQAATNPLDFDFHGWGTHRYQKAARTFAGRDLPRWLDEVGSGG